jgi:hypothetical protein
LEKISLTAYLKQNQVISEEWYDCLRYELDKHIYYYGNHFTRPLERVQSDKKEKAKYDLKMLISNVKGRFPGKAIDKSKPIVISNAYFNFNDELSKAGFTVIQPPWTNDRNSWGYYDEGLVQLCIKIKRLFEFSDFSYLLSDEFIDILKEFREGFKNFVLKEQIAALVVPNDETFFENISIKIFKAIQLPSFIFLHGLPARYNTIDENRSDYLIVWGKKLKELYEQNGMPGNKIFVSGHPAYRNLSNEVPEFSLKDVLVLTKTIPGSPHSTGVTLSDRGNLIVYLLSIQKVLQAHNVKQVRFRPHPSESKDWYMQFLDRNFFIPDTESLSNSLSRTTLTIGPVSSVFLEALFFKVNYLVYEPIYEDKNILNAKIPPPFDGTDTRIPVAYDEGILSEFLKQKKCANPDILYDYFQTSFDIGFIRQLIK